MLRKISILIKLLLVLSVLLAGTAAYFCTQPLRLTHSPVDFDIAPGDTMRVISRKVADAGVEVWPSVVTGLAQISGRSGRVKAGSYRIEQPVTPWELVGLLTAGANAYAEVTLVEGWTFNRVRAALNAHPDLRHDSLGLPDAEVMERLGLGASHPEGLFFPDTYGFPRSSSDLDLLRRAHQRMQATLEQEWAARAEGLPLRSAYEGLVLASVVEKETGKPDDRPLIASVFVNRMRAAMPLQSDPTVIYGMGSDFDGNLRKKDLMSVDNPYNTYMRSGLPPSPISMPGLAALRATFHPAPGDYLYFVARGDGTSQFSRTLEEHNLAVTLYQKGTQGGRR
jgi:UPF0755 protein